jgi:hypothetical protein
MEKKIAKLNKQIKDKRTVGRVGAKAKMKEKTLPKSQAKYKRIR